MDNSLAFILALLVVSMIFLLIFVLLLKPKRGRRGRPGPPGPPYPTPIIPQKHLLGGCRGTEFGCCRDGVTAKINRAGSNCWL